MGNKALICCQCCSKETGHTDIPGFSNRPKESDIRQQQTGGFYEDGNPNKWVDHKFSCRRLALNYSDEQRISYFILCPIMLLSLILGIVLISCDSCVIKEERYDDKVCPQNGDPCETSIELDEDMPAPIYFSYQLVNFYQSHRVYLNSKSDSQLEGAVLDTNGCNPSSSLNGKVIYPCGLLPQSVFTDRFFIDVERDGIIEFNCSATSCPRHEDNITWANYWNLYEENQRWERIGSWGGLADSKYSTPSEVPPTCTRNSEFLSNTNMTLPDPTNTDLIVWLRTAVKPTFKKPFRMIRDYDLLKGDIVHVYIFQYFNPGSKGEKYFTLETSPCLGPKTVILGAFCLGIFFFSCCISCLMLAVTMKGWGSSR